MLARARGWIRWLLGPTLPLEPVPQPLGVCAGCGQRVVVPVAWAEDAEDQWWMMLRCGECGHGRVVVVDGEQARCYGRELNVGVAEIRDELARIDRERMAVQARSFTEALARDLIDAGDFES
jgi:hypothetical protein